MRTDHAIDQEALRRLTDTIVQARRWLHAEAALRGATWGLLVSVPVWLAAATWMPRGWVAGATALGAAALGAIVAGRSSDRAAALRVDGAFGLQWRTATAWDHRRAATPMAALLLRDAAAHLPARVSPRGLLRRPPVLPLVAVVLIAVAAPGVRWLASPWRPAATGDGLQPGAEGAPALAATAPAAARPGVGEPTPGAAPPGGTTPGSEAHRGAASGAAPEASPALAQGTTLPAPAAASDPAGGVPPGADGATDTPGLGGPGGGAGAAAASGSPGRDAVGAPSHGGAGTRPMPLLAAAGAAGGPDEEATQEIPSQALLVAPGRGLVDGPDALPMRYAPVVQGYLTPTGGPQR